MNTFLVVSTFLLLLVIVAAGAWGAMLIRRRLTYLEEEQRRVKLASVEDSQDHEKQIAELTARIETIERRAAESAQHPVRSINYTQRSQMLRMIRRGDSADQIGSTLGVPVSQVRLLMKLPGMAAEAARGKTQSAGQ